MTWPISSPGSTSSRGRGHRHPQAAAANHAYHRGDELAVAAAADDAPQPQPAGHGKGHRHPQAAAQHLDPQLVGLDVLDIDSGKPIYSFDGGDCIALSWSPDGKSLASSEWENVHVWDIAAQDLQLRCSGVFVGWTADSAAVITQDNASGLVRWWDRQSGDRLRKTKFDLLPGLSIARPEGRFAACAQRACLDIWEIDRGRTSLTLVPLRDGKWLAVRPDGHYRGSPGVEKELVYVVQTEKGQELLASDEFEKKYGWKNDPQRVRLPPK
jgi:hypothetical protein